MLTSIDFEHEIIRKVITFWHESFLSRVLSRKGMEISIDVNEFICRIFTINTNLQSYNSQKIACS